MQVARRALSSTITSKLSLVDVLEPCSQSLSTGGQNAKTACSIALIQNIATGSGVPLNRLAVGFQSHLIAATGNFDSKSALSTTFSQLAALGVDVMVTELDIELNANTAAYQRYQAAIWGDYLDACLYASNCNEFINWDPR